MYYLDFRQRKSVNKYIGDPQWCQVSFWRKLRYNFVYQPRSNILFNYKRDNILSTQRAADVIQEHSSCDTTCWKLFSPICFVTGANRVSLLLMFFTFLSNKTYLLRFTLNVITLVQYLKSMSILLCGFVQMQLLCRLKVSSHFYQSMSSLSATGEENESLRVEDNEL